jgi:hypothetical protein
MHVGRLARIYLTLSGDQRITIPPKELTVGRSRIVLLHLQADGRSAEITLAALMPLTERLKLTPDRKPVLSHRMVVDSDVSITRFARAMAVAEWAPLRITSPIPHFTLAPESHRDWEFIRTLESDYVAGDARPIPRMRTRRFLQRSFSLWTIARPASDTSAMQSERQTTASRGLSPVGKSSRTRLRLRCVCSPTFSSNSCIPPWATPRPAIWRAPRRSQS